MRSREELPVQNTQNGIFLKLKNKISKNQRINSLMINNLNKFWCWILKQGILVTFR